MPSNSGKSQRNHRPLECVFNNCKNYESRQRMLCGILMLELMCIKRVMNIEKFNNILHTTGTIGTSVQYFNFNQIKNYERQIF